MQTYNTHTNTHAFACLDDFNCGDYKLAPLRNESQKKTTIEKKKLTLLHLHTHT